MEWLKTLYGILGAPFPIISAIVIFLIGGLIGVIGWTALGQIYKNDKSEIERTERAAKEWRPLSPDDAKQLILILSQYKPKVWFVLFGGRNSQAFAESLFPIGEEFHCSGRIEYKPDQAKQGFSIWIHPDEPAADVLERFFKLSGYPVTLNRQHHVNEIGTFFFVIGEKE